MKILFIHGIDYMAVVQWQYFQFNNQNVFRSVCTLMEELLAQTKPLSEIIHLLQHGKKEDKQIAKKALIHREKMLGTATLSSKTIILLSKFAHEKFNFCLEKNIITHAPSLSAIEKSDIVGGSVQKTISLKFDNTLFLCSASTSFKLTNDIKLAIADFFNLPNRKKILRSSINSSQVDPNEHFGFVKGMVNPFLPPRLIFSNSPTLKAVVLMPCESKTDVSRKISVSASLLESFVFYLSHKEFALLVKDYLHEVHPQLHVLDLTHK